MSTVSSDSILAYGGRQCYECEVRNGETMGQCINKMKFKDCGRHDDVCHTTSYKSFETWYFHKKGCAPKGQCQSENLCATLEDKTKCLVSPLFYYVWGNCVLTNCPFNNYNLLFEKDTQY